MIEEYKDNIFCPEFLSDEEAESLYKYIVYLKNKSEKQIPMKLYENEYNPIHFGDTVKGLCPVFNRIHLYHTKILYSKQLWVL